MAKYGYTCQCGWQLKRGNLTRKQYANKKVAHAETCKHLTTELNRAPHRLPGSAKEV